MTEDLPLPDEPDDAQQRRADQARDELGHEPLAAVEVAGIGGVERREALERADDGRVLAAAPALAAVLQVGDPARELRLQGAQLGAAGLRAIGDGADVARGLASRPLARGLVDAARHPRARLEQPLRRDVRRRAARRVAGGDLAHRLGVDRAELEHAGRLHGRERGGRLGGGDDEHGDVGEPRRDAGELGADPFAGAVGVVEDEQRGLGRLARAAQRDEHRVGRAVAAGVQDRDAGAVHRARELGREPRLAGAARARERDEPAAAAVARELPALQQPPELVVAADERLRRGGVQRGGQLRVGRPALQPRVLAQDRLLALAQLGPRLEAYLLDERAPRRGVGLERLGLAPAAIEREHEVGGEPLAQRVVIDELLELADDLGMAAGFEVRFDAQLERRDPLLVQARDLGGGEGLGRELGERLAAPQCQRHAQDRGGLLGLAVGHRPAGLLDELLEALGVELAIAHAQRVAGLGRREDVRIAERLAQARDVHLDRLHGAARRVLAPQRERQPLGAHRLVGVQEQDGEHRPRLVAAKRDLARGTADRDRPEDQKVHRPASDATGS